MTSALPRRAAIPISVFFLLVLVATFASAESLQEPGCRPAGDALRSAPCAGDEYCTQYRETDLAFLTRLLLQNDPISAIPQAFNASEVDRRDPEALYDHRRHDDYCGGPVSTPSGVYLFSGEFYHHAVDMRVPGRGLDFVWARKYRSRIGPDVGLGAGWDHAYNIRVLLLDDKPSEARDLDFDDKEKLSWNPPADPGGPPSQLSYCVLRSTDPSDFDDPLTTIFVELEQPDLTAEDTDEPDPGEFYSYLILPKNGSHAGPLGQRSDSTPREGLTCGLTGPDLLLEDGSGRRDVYSLWPDGTWVAPEFFRTFVQERDDRYALEFPDTGSWRFHPFDGSPWEGRIESINDRNGNSLAFIYDPAGRLITVHDTLGREYQIGYDADGFIESVTDHTGREVRYEYYSMGDPDGGFGDLRSVTTPQVVGTPTGNDYPLGKTTIYTYSKGFPEEQLNHNLLTITDPRGQTFLINEYAPTLDVADPLFDRVVDQQWGHPGERLDYVYLPVTPDPINNFATSRTIVNDRMGNVDEYFHDEANRTVMLHEYTGRASNPTLPTTDVTNRPVGPLRPDDPPLFETRLEYSPDSRVTRIVYPNQNEEQYLYDELNPDRRSQGNLTVHCRLPGPLGGDQPQICEGFEYDDFVSGGQGTNFVTRHVDGRGNETLHLYDAVGNRLRTDHRIPSIVEDWFYDPFGQVTTYVWPDNGSGIRRRDEFIYYTSGPQEGYLQLELLDTAGFALTTEYEYDDRGHVVRVIDARGNDTQYVRNALDQVVRVISRELLTAGGPVRYERDTYYDPNDNVVRVDVQNVDDQGVLQANTHYTNNYEYDPLNTLRLECSESGNHTGPIPGTVNQPTCTGLPQSEFVFTEYEYDANRNRQLVRLGEATDGDQPDNTRFYLYDERDLLFQVVRAPGHTDQSTTQYDYDGNRNLRAVREGLEGTPQVTTPQYDGYDRLTQLIDAMGNEILYGYDENGLRTQILVLGELIDLPGDAGNVRLHEAERSYDPMDRPTGQVVEFFDSQTQLSIDDGQSEFLLDYSASGQLTLRTDDNGNPTSYVYDSANRLATVTDAKGNSLSYTYDGNSNVVTLTQTDRSDLGSPDEIYYTNYTYDGLDRRIRTDNNISASETYGYDSRDNLTLYQDRLRTDPTAPGNVTRYSYDGLDRRISIEYQLTDTGNGSGALIGTILLLEEWDDSSRLTGRADGNGNLTTYSYDPLNRLIQTDSADGTAYSVTYDVHDNRVTMSDANASVSTYSYDPLNRLISKTITRGAGVQGTTLETYEYDGLNRLVVAQDDDALVTREYDSLSNLTKETINGNTIGYSYDGVGNKIQLTYPSGRVIDYEYDSLNRLKVITDAVGGLITEYEYVGGRVERRSMGNGTQTDYEYDGIANPPGDSGVKQIVRTNHTGPFGVVDDRRYTWDAMYNKTGRTDEIPTGPQRIHEYEYDSVYRLRQRVLSDPMGPIDTEILEMDLVGNRTAVFGGPDPGIYVMDPTMPVPQDRQVNQYTATPFDTRRYDENGNLAQIDPALPTQRDIGYDYRNQMTEYLYDTIGWRTNYSYDPLGRRIGRIVDVPSPEERTYLYDGHSVIEEQDETGSVVATWVYGSYMDEVLQMQRGEDDFYYHSDDMFSVMAITDDTGLPVERYEYREFGSPTVFDATWAPIGGSAIGNPYMFTGRRFEEATGWYHYRSRYLDPRAGRFTTRDTIGFWGDPVNMGNACSYVGSNPMSLLDPCGQAVLIRFEGVDGEAKEDDRDDWIDISSFSLGVGRSISTSGGGKPRAAGVRIEDIVITKELDKASPMFCEIPCPGTPYKKFELRFTASPLLGGPLDFSGVDWDFKIPDRVDPVPLPGAPGGVDLYPHLEKVKLQFPEEEVEKKKGTTNPDPPLCPTKPGKK